jgi:hypothetical protein
LQLLSVLHGAPVTAFTLWKQGNMKVTRGAEHIGHYQKNRFSDRCFCTKWGGHLMTNHPGMGFTDVCAAVLPTLPSSRQST